MKLSSADFIKKSKEAVASFENAWEILDENKYIEPDNVFVVWYCKTLQNHKALLSTPNSGSPYYEITYNGDADEVYIDVYQKKENIKVKEASHADWY